ncbi:MAG: glutamine-hydrolyzing carbamoyl-phosphate synthase small subunit [Candidatus Kapabacteria bacterium]|nr:glutamine-hydrolyzing carbamoyl-phosphate synthase small subunit [Candidatus Kapabacteria bacterium]
MKQKALIMLENGYYEFGEAFASKGTKFAEFVFNTSMTGYEEIITDPSYKGQFVVFTYPLIGNYGITNEDNQASKINAEGIIIRENTLVMSNFRAKDTLENYLETNNIFGVEGIDTRALTKQLRSLGAMKGGITTEHLNPDSFLQMVKDAESISDTDMYKLVIDNKVNTYEGTNENNLSIVAIDYGIKTNIISDLQKRFNKVHLVPFDDNFDANLSKLSFDGVFLSNGPGDPRIVKGIDKYLIDFANEKKPIIAICFGHQLIGRSFGLDVIKLPFGHHGGNHPCKYYADGKVYITAQNHNYAISTESVLKSNDWDITWENLYDGTVEGIKHKELAINAIQFHPEASPGPHEANERVFQDFFDTVNGARS